jgi:hypothetical protein
MGDILHRYTEGGMPRQAVVGYDTEHERDEPMAREIVQTCSCAYPGHDWFCVIKGGVIQIKLMDINPNWGMVLHYTQVKGDAASRKADVLRSAGEFLERANLSRGFKTHDKVKHVEGIPDKDLLRTTL